jgi:hypothetical protein
MRAWPAPSVAEAGTGEMLGGSDEPLPRFVKSLPVESDPLPARVRSARLGAAPLRFHRQGLQAEAVRRHDRSLKTLRRRRIALSRRRGRGQVAPTRAPLARRAPRQGLPGAGIARSRHRSGRRGSADAASADSEGRRAHKQSDAVRLQPRRGRHGHCRGRPGSARGPRLSDAGTKRHRSPQRPPSKTR